MDKTVGNKIFSKLFGLMVRYIFASRKHSPRTDLSIFFPFALSDFEQSEKLYRRVNLYNLLFFRFLGLAFLCISFNLQAIDVNLTAYDMEGSPSTVVSIGQPFMLEVSVDGANSTSARPEIKGLEHHYVRNGGLYMTNINGHSTTKHKYKVRIDVPGVHTVGPAKFASQGKSYSSETISIRVTDQPVPAKQPKEKEENQPAFLRLKVDKDKVVVGEKVQCSLRFYYSDEVTNVSPITKQDIPGFTVNDQVDTVRGVEKINGKNYAYLDLQWDMIPASEGKKIVPAFSAEFAVRDKSYSSTFALFLNSFGGIGDIRRAQSNVVSLQVDPLPAHNGPVHAIGLFSSFSSHLEPSVAKVGEGMVLTLEIVGKGNFVGRDSIALTNMPDSCKYYDSKNYADTTQVDKPKHFFEFIVQGLKKGEFEIPSQEFTFFDIKSRSYKTLKSQPLSISMLQAISAQQKYTASDKSQGYEIPEPKLGQADEEIKPLMMQGDWQAHQEKSLPWWAFILVTLVPFGAIIFHYTKSGFGVGMQNRARNAKKKAAFKHAKQALIIAQRNNDLKLLYPTFVTLFAHYYGVDQTQVDQEFMLSKLKEAGCNSSELDQWQQFFNHMTEYIFSNKAVRDNEYITMNKYANHWIDRLQKMV